MKSVCLGLVFTISIAVAPATAGPIMYVDDANGVLGTVDVATGTVSVIGSTGQILTDIAFDPTGHLYGITFSQLFSINAATGAATLIGNLNLSGANALVFGSNGTLYAAAFNSNDLYTVNTATGAATSLGNMGFASAGDLAFNGGNFYLASTANSLVRINLANLALTTQVGAFGVANVFGLATGSNGTLYAVAGTNVYSVNTTTGAATNPVSFAAQGLASANGESFFEEARVATPEPASVILLGTG